VYVYESAPASPRRKALALPPPPDIPDNNTISLGQWKGKLPSTTKSVSPEAMDTSTTNREGDRMDSEPEPEEGTPEYIRRRFFPNAPFRDPNLAWMELSSSPESSSSAPSSLRFDLTGTPIPASVSTTLPTHLGLHHHADGTHAGYTLDDLFLLSRSSVPAQRTTMLEVLGRIARKLGKGKKGDIENSIDELKGQEEELRKRILAAGVEAIGERGSLGARAVEVIWECLVGWDEDLVDIEGVECGEDTADTISSLPLEHVLSQISTLLAQAALPPHSLSQLLAILHRLAQHTDTIASTIIGTPKLLANIIQTFLLTPYSPTESSLLPDPSALHLLITLVFSSRSNASALVEPADALLRFITVLPPASPYPIPLATALLTSTLRFYTALASYGLYSHIATTAATYFAQVGTYVLSEACSSKALMEAWAGLLEAWIVCATDPHRTSPGHDILWSQVTGWDWGVEVLQLKNKLTTTEQDWKVWAAVWRAEAAWLEGARINGVRGGEGERLSVVEVVYDGFENGNEKTVLLGAIDSLERTLTEFQSESFPREALALVGYGRIMSVPAHTILAAMRLWLGSLPPAFDGPPLSPPFLLPFPRLSELCAKLVTHPLWSLFQSEAAPSYSRVFLRPLTSMLSYYLRLSRALPGVSQDLWMAQAISILCRLMPGDEEFGVQVITDVTTLINPDIMASHGWSAPPIIWDKGGMNSIIPFLTYTVRPALEVHIGPICITPQSILLASTQRLPSSLTMRSGAGRQYGLPLTRDWVLAPLDHLLRSATSAVFKSLPSSWDATETELVRSSLLLAKVIRELLKRYSLNDFIMNREETVFGCMKIFMLEHEQPQNDSVEEVFRDTVVANFIDDLLAPFAWSAAVDTSESTSTQGNLEIVATRFLGSSTPFYQYYTDFVALYDSISFSHPQFARLLLPPTSMRYAPDYRKHLWGDFGHVLRTIRTPVDQVISGDLREYLWPIENDGPLLSSYLQALIQGPLEGFVRSLAVHHIAYNIWPDLGGDNVEAGKSIKLLKAVAKQSTESEMREILQYRQTENGQLLLPPACFEQDGDWKQARIELIGSWLGDDMQTRLSPLLQDVTA
jgi:RNA polymerase II-associated protein 1